MSQKLLGKVALFGTMFTPWRTPAGKQLAEAGCQVMDNTDPRWHSATTWEQIQPLLAQDLRLMCEADVIVWHHDVGTEGRTARIELGYLSGVGRPVVVHVDPNVSSRDYMRAFVELHPSLRWAETMEEALNMTIALARTSS